MDYKDKPITGVCDKIWNNTQTLYLKLDEMWTFPGDITKEKLMELIKLAIENRTMTSDVIGAVSYIEEREKAMQRTNQALANTRDKLAKHLTEK